MNDEEFASAIHLEVHAIRRINNYKPSPSEKNIAKLVRTKFKDTCNECKLADEQINKNPEKKGFLSKIGDAIND